MKVLEKSLNFKIGTKPSANKSSRWVLCFTQETLSDENLSLVSVPTNLLTQLSPFLVNVTSVAKSTVCSSILIWWALPEGQDTTGCILLLAALLACFLYHFLPGVHCSVAAFLGLFCCGTTPSISVVCTLYLYSLLTPYLLQWVTASS